MYYGCITGDRDVAKMARDYYQHASWGRKLEQYKVIHDIHIIITAVMSVCVCLFVYGCMYVCMYMFVFVYVQVPITVGDKICSSEGA